MKTAMKGKETIMSRLDLSAENWQDDALKHDGPACLVIRAWLEPVAGLDRFQPAGFPEIGHVIYDAPREDSLTEKVCIVDSPASMANHLEAICIDGPAGTLHADLSGLPYVCCVTDQGDSTSESDPLDRLVCTSLTEGHRIASDYFLEGLIDWMWIPEKREKVKGKKGNDVEEITPAHRSGKCFREKLRAEFGVKEVKKDKTYFIWPEAWWTIYRTLFKYDPNSLVHGVMFAKEQIRLSRMLTAHMEAFGAARVGSSGVKFDRLGKTTSGQPIFAVDEESARTIVATFILDLALLRSYGRGDRGLTLEQKRLLLDLAIWKIKRLLQSPFRFRTGCHLLCTGIAWRDDSDGSSVPGDPSTSPGVLSVDIKASISACGFDDSPINIYYPASKLFKTTQDVEATEMQSDEVPESENDEGEGD
jgi:CRISPR-associated protein Csb1